MVVLLVVGMLLALQFAFVAFEVLLVHNLPFIVAVEGNHIQELFAIRKLRLDIQVVIHRRHMLLAVLQGSLEEHLVVLYLHCNLLGMPSFLGLNIDHDLISQKIRHLFQPLLL